MGFEYVTRLMADLDAVTDDSAVRLSRWAPLDHLLGPALVAIASDRFDWASVEPPTEPGAQASRRIAAQRVISDVCLRPEADCYELLGVRRDASSAQIRDAYRRMIALVHPDSRPTAFPQDAASRVNAAYTTLTSATGRAALDAELDRVSQNHPPRRATLVRAANADRGKTPAGSPSGRSGSGIGRLRAPKGSLLWMAGLLAFGAIAWLVAVVAPEQTDALIEARPVMTMSESLSSLPLTEPGNVRSREPGHDALGLLPGQQFDSGPVAGRLAPDLSLPPLPAPTAAITSAAEVAGSNGSSLGRGISVASQGTTATRQAGAPEAASRRPVPQPAGATPSRVADVTMRPLPSIAARNDAIDAPAPGATRVAQDGSVATPVSVASATLAPPAAPAAVAAANPVVPATTLTALTRPTAPRTATEADSAPPIEVDDILLKLIAAYEAGSTAALSRLLSPRIGGRSELLAAYDRAFRETSSRSLRLGRLTHRRIDNRVVTSGPATVTTVSLANRSEQTSIFLEIEVVREREGVFIDRLVSYVSR